jgi:hypothetical protein
MPKERFDVVFRGRLMEGQDPAQVRRKVARLFKANEAQLQRLFSGNPVSVKKGVDMETASRYRLAFREAGALVEISAGQPTQNESNESADPADHLTLVPANTGSLEEYAPKIAPAPLPDISDMSLAAVGSDHEPARPQTAPAIDTDGLGLVDGQDWTLEDCQPPPPPPLEPDLSGLDLSPPDDTSHIPPEPPPLPLPDISDMALAATDEEDEEKT